jgi:Ca-activated chloride channel family protein
MDAAHGSRHPLALALSALLISPGVAMLALVSPVAQAPQGAVSILYPRDGDYVSGPLVLKAAVEPGALKVDRVSFFADGRLVCAVEHPPFECRWNAGPRVDRHQIRVVAQLAGGRRLPAATIFTASGGYTETVDVDVLQVTALVTDAHGEYVRGLKREDFRVFENDRPQKIAGFASTDVPLEITTCVDVSGSMNDAMPQLKESVRRFLAALRPEDKATLLAFNDNIFTLAPPTIDQPARLKAVDRLEAWGGTALYDVIVQSIDALGRDNSRRTVVVFSDGEDTASHIPLETARERVESTDATVYTIGQGRGTRLAALKDILQTFARISGGRAFFTEKIEKLDEAFAKIIEELSNQYLIGYVPPGTADGQWHKIRVETVDKKYRVRHRQGYLAKRRP